MNREAESSKQRRRIQADIATALAPLHPHDSRIDNARLLADLYTALDFNLAAEELDFEVGSGVLALIRSERRYARGEAKHWRDVAERWQAAEPEHPGVAVG